MRKMHGSRCQNKAQMKHSSIKKISIIFVTKFTLMVIKNGKQERVDFSVQEQAISNKARGTVKYSIAKLLKTSCVTTYCQIVRAILSSPDEVLSHRPRLHGALVTL